MKHEGSRTKKKTETDENSQNEVQEKTEKNVDKEGSELPECPVKSESDCTGARIEIAREKTKEGDKFFWMLYAGNGKMIATNPVEYNRLNDLKVALKSVEESIKNAPVVRLY